MIISCGTVLFRKYSVEKAMQAVREAGYDYFETQGTAPFCSHIDVCACDPIKFAEKAKSYGFKGITALWMDHGRIIADPDSVKFALYSMQWCKAAGVPTLLTGDGMKPDGMSDEDAFSTFRDRLLEIVASAEKAGITVGLEPHGTFSLTSDGLLRILDITPSKSFGINYDPGNLYRASFFESLPDGTFRVSRAAKREDEVEVLTSILPRVVFFHAKDIKGDHACALGEGGVKVTECIRLLRESGYNGVLSVETNGDGTMQEELEIAKKSLKILEEACV